MPGQRQHAQRSRQVEAAPARHLRHQRVRRILRAEDLLRRRRPLPRVDLLDGHHRQQVVLAVAQRDLAVVVQVVDALHRQRHGDGEERAVGQAHLCQHALVVGAAHEAIQRRKGARRQQFQVAQRAVGELDRRQRVGMRAQRFMLVRRDDQVDQAAAVWLNQARLGFGRDDRIHGKWSRNRFECAPGARTQWLLFPKIWPASRNRVSWRDSVSFPRT